MVAEYACLSITLRRIKKKEFKPIDEGKNPRNNCAVLRFTIEFTSGNTRTFLSFDVIRRYLMHKGFEVTLAQNPTTLTTSDYSAPLSREGLLRVSESFSQAFIEQMHRFNILNPDIRPRATHEIEAMLQMIPIFDCEQGHAYAVPSGRRCTTRSVLTMAMAVFSGRDR